MKAKKFVLSKNFSGIPTQEDISLVGYELNDELKEGEVLFQSIYLSVDPYMRIFGTEKGQPMIGEHLAEVIKTRNGKFPIGTLVLSKAGWQSHYISNGDETSPLSFDLGSTPISYTLGILGMPGATAYLSLKKCDLKSGETVLVTSAAGAVGHIVGQLAKLEGCTVIGVVGSDEKAAWCKNDLKFDHVINYKTCDLGTEISKVAPEGIDVFYDNVGGEFYHEILTKHMKLNGRVLVVGSIQTYNDIEAKQCKENEIFIELFEYLENLFLFSVPATNVSILMKQLTVRGFQVYLCENEWPQAFTEINKLIREVIL